MDRHHLCYMRYFHTFLFLMMHQTQTTRMVKDTVVNRGMIKLSK